jgi:CDGSH-type Zn-finger protein
MADEPSITTTPNGPYLVSGARLVVKVPVHTEQGEPIAWATGPTIPTNERYALCRCGHSARKPFCDGTHARIEFEADESDAGSYAERSKAYEGTGVVVRDDRSICVHSGFCGNEVTNVWKMVRHTDDTTVRSQMIAMVERCPSGALTYSIGDEPIEPDLATDIAVVPDGPLFVSGAIPVTLSDGTVLEGRNRMTLCRCGESAHKPLCDGSHKDAGFRHTPEGAPGPVIRSGA